MKFTAIAVVLGLGAMCLAAPPRADEPPPPEPIASPFDRSDAEVKFLKSLDWKGIDFEAADLNTRTTAMLALSKVLGMLGGKADARIDLMLDYLAKEKLEEAYAEQLQEIPPFKQIAFDDAKKVAVALVRHPEIQKRFSADLEGSQDTELKAYLKMYENASRRAYSEVIESRYEARAMGLFLQKQGKLKDFLQWAEGERQRRQKEYDAAMNAKRDQYAQAQAAKKGKAEAERIASVEKRQTMEHQRNLEEMEMALKYQQQALASAPQTVVVDDDDWDNTWWPWTGAYYATNSYRGQVRDRPRPTPRGGRGGGGRR